MNRKNLLFLSTLILGLSASAAPVQAQKATDPEKFYRAPNSIHGKSVVIPTGAHFEGRMNETISSKTRQGQRFSIEITSPILANATDVIIPSGSKIMGEVVEAIPSGKQDRTKNKFGQKNPKKTGKLRTQLTSIVTPDGLSYPIVATIMHDYTKNGQYDRPNKELGSANMGYVGSQTSFDAVQSGFDTRAGGNRGPKVVGKREFMRDPIMGMPGQKSSVYGTPIIRSIQKKGHEIYIYSGSPLTVHLDAPLKMSIAPGKGALSIDLDPVQPSMEQGANTKDFRRFQPVRRQEEVAEEEQPPPQAVAPQQPVAPDPEEGVPAFLRKKKSFSNSGGFSSPQGQAPQFSAPQGGVPPQQGAVAPSQNPGESF
ncbi:MAG: hypothetical protein SGJ27_28710 [Candidatus Melainabacteria bacterium]|nr:hypothetical protein [Candidatus Melainabacteria bacterium]